jgi:hypothetical protein
MALSPLSLLPMLLLPRLPTVLTKFFFCVSHIVLLWFCVMVMLKNLSRALVFLAFSPPPPLLLFALNLPCRLAAVADALLVWLIPICFFSSSALPATQGAILFSILP